jgi:hypothetical protein
MCRYAAPHRLILTFVSRYCIYCLGFHLSDDTDPGTSKAWMEGGWKCPTCRSSCCCSTNDCTRNHRHCKAYRFLPCNTYPPPSPPPPTHIPNTHTHQTHKQTKTNTVCLSVCLYIFHPRKRYRLRRADAANLRATAGDKQTSSPPFENYIGFHCYRSWLSYLACCTQRHV